MRAPLALGLLAVLGCGSSAPMVASPVQAADRSPDDVKLDGGRKPTEMLVFAGITPGQHVADLGAGGGYTTELLARAVGPTGVVYGQNSAAFLGFVGKAWDARLAKPVMKNVVRVDRELDDPLPPEATNLDAVVLAFIYHDTVWIGVDRDRMNKAVFNALKPGGEYLVLDHSGRAGSGVTEVKTLHRIEEKALVAEVEKAGFKLAASAEFLRNPSDQRDWNDSPTAAGERRGTSDRFVLKFVKP